MNKTASERIYFKTYSYRGDKYSSTYGDIVNKNNESAINPLSNERSNILYALPIDKILVTLDTSPDGYNNSHDVFSKYSNTNVIWDFGDGTKSTDVSALHWYKFPGTYRIRLYVYDSEFNTFESPYNVVVNVYNYVPHELPINELVDGERIYDYTYGDLIAITPTTSAYDADSETLYWLDDKYLSFELQKFNSWQSYNVVSSIGYNIQLTADNTISPTITHDEYYSNAYSHLSCYSMFIDNNEYTNLIHFNVYEDDNVYVTFNSTSSIFVTSNATDPNAVFVGNYSTKQIKFIDELPTLSGTRITINATFDTTGFKNIDNVDSALQQQWYNHIPYTFSFTNLISSVSSFDYDNFNSFINTCGLSGTQYNFFNYKYINTPIQFVWQITYNNQPFKLIKLPNLSSNGHFQSDEISGYIELRTASDTISPEHYAFDSFSSDGEQFGGYLKSSSYVYNTYDNVSFHVFADLYKDGEIIKTLHAQSNQFNVINNDIKFKVFKVGEDFDLQQTYKNVALQPILKESNVLFDDIIGNIVGNNNDYNNLGVRIYEKIHNFVINTQDIDTCNISFLYDTYHKFDEYIVDINYDWPEEINRLVNLFSIKFEKLRYNINQFDRDFDNKGYQFNPNYGKNLGEQIDFYSPSAFINTNETIVAYEKFSGKYIKLNCNIDKPFIEKYTDTSKTSSYTTYYNTTATVYFYHISGLVDSVSVFSPSTDTNHIRDVFDNRDNWGWNLILPQNSSYNINDYYKFYRFKHNNKRSTINNIIDWDNKYNICNIDDLYNINLSEWQNYKLLQLFQTVYNGLQVLNNHNIIITQQPVSQTIKYEDDNINIVVQPIQESQI